MTAAASRATGIVLQEGGYVSSEQARIDPADHARSTVSLQLKVPVAAYDRTLATLSAVLGTQTALTQHAQDVTQQVADVGSLVTSAQAAITQLQALLKRAGLGQRPAHRPGADQHAGIRRWRRCRPSSARWPGRPATRPCR